MLKRQPRRKSRQADYIKNIEKIFVKHTAGILLSSRASVWPIYFMLLLLLYPQTSFGQSSKAKEIDAYITPFAKAGHFSGVILATQDGKVIYEKAFGLANADFKIPNQVNTRIPIASITKLMTGAILHRLVEEKKISLEDKLSKYIPDFPSGEKITILMLRTHRSGLPHRILKPEEESLSYTSAEMVEKIKQAKVAFEPGTQRLYSSTGYTVLARVLEIASSKSYAELLQEYVFTPADMRDSLNFDSEMIIERRAQDYLLAPNGLINAPLKDYSFLVGAGSVISTAKDVYKFSEAVLDGKFGEATKSANVMNNEIIASGFTNGHYSFSKINRDKKWGYVLVSNLASGANEMIRSNLESILDGKEAAAPLIPNPKIIPNPNKNLSEFNGKYLRQGVASVEIVAKNNILVSSEFLFYPTKPDCFFEYKFYGEVCFVRDDTGKIKHIDWATPVSKSIWVKQ